MDLSPRFASNATVQGSPIAGSAITVVCTLTVPNFGRLVNVSGVFLEAACALTVGTNGVSILMQVRQTGTAGTVIATTGAVTATAASLYAPATQGLDTAPLAAGVWVVCLTMASSTASTTISSVSLIAIAV
jgi:hypothetical protein